MSYPVHRDGRAVYVRMHHPQLGPVLVLQRFSGPTTQQTQHPGIVQNRVPTPPDSEDGDDSSSDDGSVENKDQPLTSAARTIVHRPDENNPRDQMGRMQQQSHVDNRNPPTLPHLPPLRAVLQAGVRVEPRLDMFGRRQALFQGAPRTEHLPASEPLRPGGQQSVYHHNVVTNCTCPPPSLGHIDYYCRIHNPNGLITSGLVTNTIGNRYISIAQYQAMLRSGLAYVYRDPRFGFQAQPFLLNPAQGRVSGIQSQQHTQPSAFPARRA